MILKRRKIKAKTVLTEIRNMATHLRSGNEIRYTCGVFLSQGTSATGTRATRPNFPGFAGAPARRLPCRAGLTARQGCYGQNPDEEAQQAMGVDPIEEEPEPGVLFSFESASVVCMIPKNLRIFHSVSVSVLYCPLLSPVAPHCSLLPPIVPCYPYCPLSSRFGWLD